jgi:SPFH domain / Band 7 family
LGAWGAIQYVTTGLTLAAFVVAAILFAYRARLKQRADIIKSAPKNKVVDAIATEAEFFQVDVSDLSEETKKVVVLRQIQNRARREAYFAALALVVAVILGWIAFVTVSGNQQKSGEANSEQKVTGVDTAPKEFRQAPTVVFSDGRRAIVEFAVTIHIEQSNAAKFVAAVGNIAKANEVLTPRMISTVLASLEPIIFADAVRRRRGLEIDIETRLKPYFSDLGITLDAFSFQNFTRIADSLVDISGFWVDEQGGELLAIGSPRNVSDYFDSRQGQGRIEKANSAPGNFTVTRKNNSKCVYTITFAGENRLRVVSNSNLDTKERCTAGTFRSEPSTQAVFSKVAEFILGGWVELGITLNQYDNNIGREKLQQLINPPGDAIQRREKLLGMLAKAVHLKGDINHDVLRVIFFDMSERTAAVSYDGDGRWAWSSGDRRRLSETCEHFKRKFDEFLFTFGITPAHVSSEEMRRLDEVEKIANAIPGVPRDLPASRDEVAENYVAIWKEFEIRLDIPENDPAPAKDSEKRGCSARLSFRLRS